MTTATRPKKTNTANQTDLTADQTNVESEQVTQKEVEESLEAKPEENTSTLKVILFSSTACSPCKTVKPALANLMEASEAEYLVLTIDPENIDSEVMKQFDEYGVTQVPTVICEKDGKEIDRTTGFSGIKQLSDFISKFISDI